MENLLQIMIVLFMFFLCTLCLFAVLIIVRDILRENKALRQERLNEASPKNNLIQQDTENVDTAVADDGTDIPKEPELNGDASDNASVTVDTDKDEGAVSFNRVSMSIEEKYNALSSEFKRYFDDTVRYVLAKDGVKEFKHSSSYDYKIGAYKVLKIMIKRNDIVCEFQFIDNSLNQYVTESNVKIKQSATQVKISDASAAGAVKDGIDLICKQIETDKERKKELAKEKRREKRKAARAENEALHNEQNN